MAGDWIKMRINLWDDPRVARICDMTGSSEAAVVGGLYWLWATADQHSTDGVMDGLSIKAIDRKTQISGFGNALCVIGWIFDHSEGVRVARFDEHNGASAKKRIQTAQRVANFKSKTQGNDEGNASSVSDALAERDLDTDLDTDLDKTNLSSAEDKIPPTQHLPIVAAYNAILGNTLTPVKPALWSGSARATALQSRWKEDPERHSLEWWEGWFRYIAKSPFLTGNNDKNWKPDLGWLLKKENFIKVCEGKYHG